MSTTKNRFFSAQVVLIALSMAALASAGNLDAVVDGVSGPETDGYAAGRFMDSMATVANWSLTTSVSGTDFSNDAIQGGSNGIQYVMLNSVEGSADVNSITFMATPVVQGDIGISISQSPYFDVAGTWNGGNVEAAQFSLLWNGGGTATVRDPDDQLALGDGAVFASGTNVMFASSRVMNESDSWGIDLPENVNEVTVQWSSSNPNNNYLTREWVSFDVNLSAVPEPTTGALLSMAILSLGLLRRQRR